MTHWRILVYCRSRSLGLAGRLWMDMRLFVLETLWTIFAARFFSRAKLMRCLLILPLFAASWLPMNASAPVSWQAKVEHELPLLGHRNWIVIVDSAYPWQQSLGIETVETGTDQVTVLQVVLQAIQRSSHVRPVVFMDTELPFVTDRRRRARLDIASG